MEFTGRPSMFLGIKKEAEVWEKNLGLGSSYLKKPPAVSPPTAAPIGGRNDERRKEAAPPPRRSFWSWLGFGGREVRSFFLSQPIDILHIICTLFLHGRVMIVGVTIDWQRQCGQFNNSQSPLSLSTLFLPLLVSVLYIAEMPISSRRWTTDRPPPPHLPR
jgi:hypothetical protein